MSAQSPRPPVENVLVVGGGIAALAAALAARAFGAEVRIVGRLRGLSHRASGAWDAGDPTSLPSLLAGPLTGLHREAQHAVIHALGSMRPLAVDARTQPLIATAEGRLRRVASSDDRVLDLAGKTRIAIAQVEGCGLDARALSRSLNEQDRDGLRFFVIDVEYGRRMQDALTNASTALARSLDDDASLARLEQALRRALGGHDVDALLMPPILGLDRNAAQRLGQALRLPVGEVVASHSIQSERLSLKLEQAFRSIDGKWLNASVTKLREAKRGIVVELEGASPSLITPQLIMATGRTLEHVDGVLVDSDARATEGALKSERVRYCGSMLRHLDPRQGVPLGLIAASGWWAGMRAARRTLLES